LERCDRDGGTWKNSRPVRRDLKNSRTGEFFRVIPFKSVIRFEYFYKNRYISTEYVWINHLFDNFKVLKNLCRCNRDGGTWKNSRPVRRDLKNSQTGEFFRVIQFKSVIRFEYFYKNRYISTEYVGINHLFGNFKVLKNLGRCDRDCWT
jgi:hypothetical protein